MPAAVRLGDKSSVDSDAHGCPACPHPGTGPVVTGSSDVTINGLPAGRADNTDLGIHAACCGPNIYSLDKGSPTVYVNDKPLSRLGDATKHCGGSGKTIEGSPDVMIDDGADAQGLGSYAKKALEAVQGALNAAAAGEAKQHSDSHDGGDAASPSQDLAGTGSGNDSKSGSIQSAGWSQARASNGQEVEIQIACKDGKGSLKIEIWARAADPTQDKSVQKLDAQAGDSVKQKVKLDIPADAAPDHECFFYYVVKDEKGGEKKSPTIYVDRAPFRFST